MKLESGEYEIRLIPESEYEKDILHVLKNKGVEKIEWQDTWEQSGPLILKLRNHSEW